MISGLRKAEVMPPVAEERSVHIMIFGMLVPSSRDAEPPLKNSQLTMSKIVPNTMNGNEVTKMKKKRWKLD